MAYTSFDLHELRSRFHIREDQQPLFPDTASLPVPEKLKTILDSFAPLARYSEKAKCEAIVFPILAVLRETLTPSYGLYSGIRLDADPHAGLTGQVDFLLAGYKQQLAPEAPFLTVVEAKHHDLDLGIPQCVAQLLGLRQINRQNGISVVPLYGIVTTGTEWQFLRLEEDDTLTVDTQLYSLVNLDDLLGVLVRVIREGQAGVRKLEAEAAV